MVKTDTGLVRATEDAEERWFYGGGVHRWLVRAAEADDAFFLHEERLEAGKATPLHTHPADETMIVIAGVIRMHIDGEEFRVETGGVAIARRGVPHAFKVVTDGTRLLCMHTPGTCEPFYLLASAPLAEVDTVVDFDRVAAAARETGGMQLVGPPPFAD